MHTTLSLKLALLLYRCKGVIFLPNNPAPFSLEMTAVLSPDQGLSNELGWGGWQWCWFLYEGGDLQNSMTGRNYFSPFLLFFSLRQRSPGVEQAPGFRDG